MNGGGGDSGLYRGRVRVVMRGTAAGAGRTLGVVFLVGLALVCAAALALHLATPVELDVAALALGATLAAVVGLIALRGQIDRTRTQQEKVSEELDLLAQTLLRIETSLAALDGSGSKAKSTLDDVAGDVHSLSQVVRSLAEAMAVQDREIVTLKQRGDPPMSYRSASALEPLGASSLPAPSFVPSFLPPAREAAAAALSDNLTTPAPGAAEGEGHGRIVAAATAGDIDLHAQAIVDLPQRRERVYEMFPLLHAGQEPLLPAQYTAALAGGGALPTFELDLVARSLVFAHRLAAAGSDARVSVPLSAASVEDNGFMRRLEALVEDHGAAGRRLVLELGQDAWTAAAAGSEVLGRMRRAGVCFALREVTDENLNPPALARLGIRHVRLDTRRIIAAIDSDGAHADLVTLIGALGRSGIEVVAEGVEDDVVVPELIDIGVTLAQGFGLALPCPADAILERPARPVGAAKAPPSPEPPPKPNGSGPSQGSLRDFLRRAG
ncbi:MAG: diguanylate phosphodiesterase [Enterovirga sp.]|jgi:EAL domain-containing protein (putative c-di-GMP-specific phosphodiesterase class I)|nr:diguanylate phosphodiesterase [Enterovirga sp.]